MKDTTINDVVAFLDATFHPEIQEDYDNAGFLVGNGEEAYRGTLVAVDLSPSVMREAIAIGANLIVTHHPFIFSGIKRVTDRTETGRMIMGLLENHMGVYAAHTNLDNLPWGVNGILCEKLGIGHGRILRVQQSEEGEECGAGMVGELAEPMEVQRFLEQVKNITGQPTLRTSHHCATWEVQRIAVCGGAGSFLIADAIAAGAEMFITSDLKYHDFQRPEEDIILVDCGHYETEQYAKTIFYRIISEKFSNFVCQISNTQGSLVQYI